MKSLMGLKRVKMIISNNEAFKKICPFVTTTAFHGYEVNYCIANLCMAWHIVNYAEGSEPHGRCKLIEKENK